MLDRKPQTTVGAYEAKTKFSELIARAEKGESFVVTKNGRPVARIAPPADYDREQARKAVAAMQAFRDSQGPPVSPEQAQRNWEELKGELNAEEDAEDESRWPSLSTRR
jgi:prevent-host-death family protein